jgi:hypothetical protein
VGDGFAAVGFVDHGGEDHEAVETELFAVAGEAGGDHGGVFGDTGEDGDAAGDDGFQLAQDN